MHLHEMIDHGKYTVFSRMGDENKEAHIKMVNYIADLAIQTGTNIGSWNILEIFGTGKGNHLVMDKREVNALFFNKVKPKKATASAAKSKRKDIPVDLVDETINKKLSKYGKGNIGALENMRDRSLSTAHDIYVEYMDELKKANDAAKKIFALKKEGIDYVGQIRQVITDGFWEYIQFDGRNIVFRSKADIICRHVKKSAGVNLTVNFGRFEAEFDAISGRLRVSPFKDNIIIDNDIFHPHICSEICWGSAAGSAAKMMASRDLINLMRLLANLAMDYCDDNPYQSMYEFHFMAVGKKACFAKQTGATDDDIKAMFAKEGLEENAFDEWQSMHHDDFFQEFIYNPDDEEPEDDEYYEDEGDIDMGEEGDDY